MDRSSASLDFAAIGHQDNWHTITSFVNDLRVGDLEMLSMEKIRNIFSFIPPRVLFKVKVMSETGAEINGVYIETFIDPDKLDAQSVRTNITKVKSAISLATRLGARMVALGGFTSILLEGNLDSFTTKETKFTTGNTLTAAFIIKGVEKAATNQSIDLQASTLLCIGATGDIGLACVHYLKHKVKKLLLCARNHQRLEATAKSLRLENIDVGYSTNLEDLVQEADIIICVASSAGIKLDRCKKDVLICDAGYPKNVEATVIGDVNVNLFHGGMGQVKRGFGFCPDYSKTIYAYAAPDIIHGCLLEAMVLAFEKRYENYSTGKGNITPEKIEEVFDLSRKHGIYPAPYFNAKGLWPAQKSVLV
ncbi:MAG: hypothetical protein ABIQ02_11655 [Saprospiraceae bacterium]